MGASVILCMIFWFVLFRRKWSFDGFMSSLMILFYTFFPSIVTRIALTSSCQKYGSRVLLTEALSVECWQEKHWRAISTVGIPGLLIYVIIIPLALARKMIKQRRAKTLYYDQEKYDPKWTLRYGFVFAGYRSGYEWWESIIMLRKCCFVLLSIFLGVYGATPQVVAASMVLVVALSLQLQYRPFQNEDHNLLENIGLHACLLQLLVALMCNSVGKNNNTLSEVSTIVLIIVMFGSSVGFFWWTLRVTVQNSQNTEGAVGVFANIFACCCKRKKIPLSNVVPIRTQKDAYTIAALRMKASVQEALKIKAINKATRIVPLKNRNKLAKVIEKSIHKSKVETIQNNHTASSNNRKKRLQQRQTERHNKVQARLEARRKAKQTNALQKCVIFSELDDASVSTIIDLMEYQVIQKTGTGICKQGEFADVLYLIITGTCKVIKNGNEIAVLTEENGIFGEAALYPDQNGIALRGATVQSMGSADVQLLCLTKEKFDRLVASNTLNEDCMNKLKQVAEKRAKENDAKEDEGDNGNKDSIENIRIEIVSRVKTEKKLKKIFQKIDLDKSNSIDREEFHAFLMAAFGVTTKDVLFEKIWNVVLDIGNEDG